MSRRVVVVVLIAVALGVAGVVLRSRARRTPPHYTGFVEGEERVVRSEVAGRVVAVAFAEGETVPAGAVLARLDDADIASQIRAKEQEIRVLEADIATQRERVPLVEATWKRELAAREADVRQAEAAADLAERTFARERDLVARGASTAQELDDRRAARDQAASALARARSMLARTAAEERNITVARRELASLEEKRALALRQLEELNVTHAKYEIHAPAVPTVVQTQLIWPGELAQPGTPIAAVLDPKDKYVQIYVPVADRAQVRVGRRVEIELDSEPGRRVPGEVSFIADEANFTPEKIETRSDRLGQVYRAKVRILEGVERFQPGTEGDVYLVGGGA
jgi:HlyD family secretion protein